MEYSDYQKYGNEQVDGFILQAPVSDREAFSLFMSKEELEASLKVAKDLIDAGKAQSIMPQDKVTFKTPITAYRWHSLMAHG